MGAQRLVVDGLPVLDIARTAVDIAREHQLPHGVVAIDAARQLGVSLAELWSAIDAMYRWPGITTARLALEFSDGGAESVGETLARMMLELELGIGPVQTQFELRDDTRHARCDMRVGRHLVEFNGRNEYPPDRERRRCGRRPGSCRLGGEATAGLAPRLPPRHVPPRVGRASGATAAESRMRAWPVSTSQTCAMCGTSMERAWPTTVGDLQHGRDQPGTEHLEDAE